MTCDAKANAAPQKTVGWCDVVADEVGLLVRAEARPSLEGPLVDTAVELNPEEVSGLNRRENT